MINRRVSLQFPLTVREAYQEASSFLQTIGIEDYLFEAELCIRRLLGVDRSRFFVMLSDRWPGEKSDQLVSWLDRRQQGEPLQYILGEQSFFGRTFYVDQNVLIPRPETELLIEAVIHKTKQKWADRSIHVVDVGTGSGAIAITLALECPHWHVTAIDVSKAALETAQKNARYHHIEDQITWIHGEYLSPLIEQKREFEVLVSNPPYIPTATIAGLEKQVRAYEPTLALDGGIDGLNPYRTLIKQLSQFREPKVIGFEIGHDQGRAVAELIQTTQSHAEVEVQKDLAGHDRVILVGLD
ncbi:peptide chain release factor N(5)-glutamine methyltransferase [Hazenella sp. IB182357]|uniref:Release factor glutamine methyltransferase n=1 Tax=Polycladospora coralii TaxID=2771432 RepID=A0A926NEK2_9BACL|nr:peptide chain release factor N(5)-glutamine methyltransferase [Polycladospora coralii]MBD1372114.1 peptide chain release factor N(5)-glutamine methyltransferase [Polycladospora coralii]MBS7530620.1 peptide chain release factor N(5)-glutamine methyltransferase [Polycladospora coralii]